MDDNKPEITKASVQDAAVIAQILVSSWREAYKGIMPADMLNNLSVERQAEGWHKHLVSGGEAYLLRVSGEYVGVVEVCEFRDKVEQFIGCGEIPIIYLIPQKFGMGFGSRLIDYALATLMNRGFRKICIWVLDKNERAIAFYRKHGFESSGHTKIHEPTKLLERLFVKTMSGS